MTGPEHYREAERLLNGAKNPPEGVAHRHIDTTIAAAHVHALMALVAATAEPIAQSYCGDEAGTVSRAWSKAIS